MLIEETRLWRFNIETSFWGALSRLEINLDLLYVLAG